MALLRIDKIMHQFYVHHLSAESYTVICQNIHLPFKVVAIFADSRVCQNLSEILMAAA